MIFYFCLNCPFITCLFLFNFIEVIYSSWIFSQYDTVFIITIITLKFHPLFELL